MRIISLIQQVVTNPNVYIAALISTLIGLGVGGAIGMFAGGFIAYTKEQCGACLPYMLDVNIMLLLSIISGLILGACAGASIIGSITIYQIHRKFNTLSMVSSATINNVLKETLSVSIELAIGLLLGAIIGSLKQPGYGSLIGALFGISLMLISTSLEKKSKK